jgi:hypothetical protein
MTMSAVDGSEFAGGRITGPVLDLGDAGLLLFGLSLLLLFWYPRVSAAIATVASLVISPLLLYIVVPGTFRRMFRGEWSIPLNSNFAWNPWAIFGIVAVSAALFVSVQSFYGLLRQGYSR